MSEMKVKRLEAGKQARKASGVFVDTSDWMGPEVDPMRLGN
ncbi:MAG: hypothetical protein ABMA01_21245 [Chthoniobacteraceae bacterium]